MIGNGKRQSLAILMALGLVLATALVQAEPKEHEIRAEVKPLSSGGSGGKQGVFANVKMQVTGKDRFYRLVVPKGTADGTPYPIVFAFHGLGDSKDFMSWYSKLDKLAEERKFILAYPDAISRAWPIWKPRAGDDLAFFDALYNQLGKTFDVDLNRVYLTGMSNRAFFSHVVASERSEKIAAIAVHSGGLGLVACWKNRRGSVNIPS